MDTDDRVEPRDDDQAASGDAGTAVDPASATIIGANIVANNAAPFPGGVVAPAAELAAEEADEEQLGALNLDALDRFKNRNSETGDGDVSTEQSELEADELNG